MTPSHSSSVIEKSMRSRRMPALLTRTSSPPNVSMACCTRLAAPSHELTSSVFAAASPPVAVISSTTSWAGPVSVPVPSPRAAEVVHDDLGAVPSERPAYFASQAPTGARHDADATFTHAPSAHLLLLLPVGLVPESIAQSCSTNPRACRGAPMAWDFSTDPEYAEQLAWVETFVREECEPLDLDHRGVARPERPGAPGADPAAAADRQGSWAVGHPSRARARRPGLRPGEAGAAERDPRPVASAHRSSSAPRRPTPATARSSPSTARPS